jgi:signal transduction histidine kinase
MRFMSRMVPARGDLALALTLVALSQIEVWHYGVAGGNASAAMTQAAAAFCVAWRSRFPLAAAVAVIAVTFVGGTISGDPVSVTLVAATIILFYSLGTLPNRRLALAGLVFGLVVAIPMAADHALNTYLAIALTSFAVPWLIGTLRLRHQRTRELEVQREEAARVAVAEERTRLARELHDIVSHNVGMIVVQAGAGDVLLDQQPERAREALQAIEHGAREALVELRRLLGLLRANDQASLAPQPTLASLDALVDRVREAGVAVDVRIEGEVTPLEAALEVTAYRIVQEGLTNVLKHAGLCRARVTIRYRPNAIEVEVADSGQGPNGTQGGYGLAGIRERVALIGGAVENGPGDDGGHVLRARLPLVPGHP